MRVLIADNHAVLRQSLVPALKSAPDIETGSEAPDGGAIEAAEKTGAPAEEGKKVGG